VSRSRLPHAWLPSPNIEPRKDRREPQILLLHYTGMKSADAALAWLLNPHSKVSCHYLVDDAGGITQMVDETMRAWHAGIAQWKGERDINSLSIGIEIHNPGHTMGYPAFPLAQMDALVALCRDIVGRHAIPPQCVLGHSDVAPRRKIDPGEKFDWRLLHAGGIGHWVKPAPFLDGPAFCSGSTGDEVAELQSLLLNYGYEIDVTGRFDALTETTVRAFQRHFRQERVDGIADTSTVDTLRRLVAAPSSFTVARRP
jgi:N-acetylmuramoyl-L-alanine amidase